MLNKRGQGLSTNAIILIVLGVVVLVVLIAGFTMGWKSIAPWLSNENVDTIVTSCESACSTQSIYGYCTKLREMNVEGLSEPINETCRTLAEDEAYTQYGVRDCPGLCPE